MLLLTSALAAGLSLQRGSVTFGEQIVTDDGQLSLAVPEGWAVRRRSRVPEPEIRLVQVRDGEPSRQIDIDTLTLQSDVSAEDMAYALMREYLRGSIGGTGLIRQKPSIETSVVSNAILGDFVVLSEQTNAIMVAVVPISNQGYGIVLASATRLNSYDDRLMSSFLSSLQPAP